MGIRAVVADIGGVLEITPAMDFDKRWEAQLGLTDGAIFGQLGDVFAAGAVGSVTEDEVHEAITNRLGITPTQTAAMLDDMWTQYLGVANTELIDYLRGLRPRYRTGTLSNSFVGAREREQAAYGLENLVDVLIYSHEVGLTKPDPRVYQLTCTRLGVLPEETIFLDDIEGAVDGARAVGIHAVHYQDNAQAITEIEQLLNSTA